MDKISINQLRKRLSIKFLKENPCFDITSHGVVIFHLAVNGTVQRYTSARTKPNGTVQPVNGTLQFTKGTRPAAKDTPLNKPVKKPVNKPFKTYFKTKDNPAGL